LTKIKQETIEVKLSSKMVKEIDVFAEFFHLSRNDFLIKMLKKDIEYVQQVVSDQSTEVLGYYFNFDKLNKFLE